jgi:hypothetical protein
MCILLYFPSPDDPRPEPPATSICMPRPVEPAVTDAVSVHVLPAPTEHPSSPLSPPSALRVIASPNIYPAAASYVSWRRCACTGVTYDEQYLPLRPAIERTAAVNNQL